MWVELLDHAPTRTQCSATASLHVFNPNRLDVGELPDSVRTQFPAVARPLHSPKGNARIGRHHSVDEHHSRFQVVDEALAFFGVVRPRAGSQSKAAIVRDTDGAVTRLGSKHPSDPGKDAGEPPPSPERTPLDPDTPHPNPPPPLLSHPA